MMSHTFCTCNSFYRQCSTSLVIQVQCKVGKMQLVFIVYFAMARAVLVIRCPCTNSTPHWHYLHWCRSSAELFDQIEHTLSLIKSFLSLTRDCRWPSVIDNDKGEFVCKHRWHSMHVQTGSGESSRGVGRYTLLCGIRLHYVVAFSYDSSILWLRHCETFWRRSIFECREHRARAASQQSLYWWYSVWHRSHPALVGGW